jgi:hypothetical protein
VTRGTGLAVVEGAMAIAEQARGDSASEQGNDDKQLDRSTVGTRVHTGDDNET